MQDSIRSFLGWILRISLGACSGLGCAVLLIRVFPDLLPVDSRLVLLSMSLMSEHEPGGFWPLVAIAALLTPWSLGLVVSGIVAAHFWPPWLSLPLGSRTGDQDIIDSGNQKQLVITVHGTFAADSCDRGSNWWQIGSSFAQAVNESGNLHMATPHHWTGENIETARRQAAREICSRVLQLEREGIPYHIVGHSHGGNVIWLALRRARRRRKLVSLRSWTTVGTPFFCFGLRKFEPDLLLPVAFGALLVLGMSGYPPTAFLWKKTMQMMPILDIFQGQKTLAVLGQVLSGALWALLVLLLLRVGLQVAGLILGVLRQRQEAQAYRDLGTRHLALWSVSDEALAGLIGASHLDDSDVGVFPRMALPGSSLLTKVASPVLLPLVAGYNYLAAPLFNFVVRRRMKDKLHGNPYWLSHVQRVTPYPAGIAGEPGLTGAEQEEVTGVAAQSALATLTAARGALGVFVAGGRFAVFRSRLQEVSLDGLIHTSYFSCPSIVRRIREHMEQLVEPAAPEAQSNAEPAETLRWWQPIEPRRAVVYCTAMAALYAGSLYIYRTAVEPSTINAKITAMMKEGDRIAEELAGNDARTWFAVRCSAGMCGEIPALRDGGFQARFSDNLSDPQLAPLLEAIRWSSACDAEGCSQRDHLIDILMKLFSKSYIGRVGVWQEEQIRNGEYFWFRSPLERWYLLASMLGGVRRVPRAEDAENPAFTPLPEERLRKVLEEAAAQADAELRGSVLYLLPFFDLQLTPAQTAEWDRDLSPARRLEAKIRLAEGMACRTDLEELPRAAPIRLRAVRPLARIEAEMKTNSIWWGECEKHNAVASTALKAAESDWREARTPLLTARLAAAVEITAIDGGLQDPELLEFLLRLDAESERDLRAAIHRRDIRGAVQVLQTRFAFNLEEGLSKDYYTIQQELLAHIDWSAAPVRELAMLAANRRGEEKLANEIVLRTARMETTPYTWDEPLYHLIRDKGHMLMRQRVFHECDSGSREHCRKWMAYVTSTSLWYSVQDLYNPMSLRADRERQATLQLEVHAGSDLAATGVFDRKLESRVMSDLATAATAGSRFHQALDYARKSDFYPERLRAYEEILANWDRLRRVTPDLDELVDRGLLEPAEATAEYIRNNPSH
ncbi:MAG: hypothetical protein IH602_19300 [Bryobacteraceae bacterium]|nr:hypothetical protein [Bryobacteraceae bacterium]